MRAYTQQTENPKTFAESRRTFSDPWELSTFVWLLVAVQARDERIRRLEQFNRSLAVELDRVTGMRSQVGRRAA